MPEPTPDVIEAIVTFLFLILTFGGGHWYLTRRNNSSVVAEPSEGRCEPASPAAAPPNLCVLQPDGTWYLSAPKPCKFCKLPTRRSLREAVTVDPICSKWCDDELRWELEDKNAEWRRGSGVA